MGVFMKIGTRELKDYPWYIKPFFWAQKRKYGQILDSSRVWARSPRLFFGLSVLFGAIDRRHSPIDPALRYLVIVRVSQLNNCDFCIDLNSYVLIMRHVSQEKINAIPTWKENELFSPKERAALEYAEYITLTTLEANNELLEKLEKHFNEDQIIELTAIIAYQNMSTKFNTVLGIKQQGFCQLK